MIKRWRTIERLGGGVLWVLFSLSAIWLSYELQLTPNPVHPAFPATLSAAILAALWVLWRAGDSDAWFWLGALVSGFAVAFGFFAKSLLYSEDGLRMDMSHVGLFSVLILVGACYAALVMHLLTDLRLLLAGRRPPSRKWLLVHCVALFALTMGALGLYLYGLNPGNMSPDTVNQLGQVTGRIPWNTWHPLGHTLFIGFLYWLWPNVLGIALFQIIFLAAVLTSFYRFLLQRGLAAPLVYVCAAIIAVVPSTGINAVTLWKDIPFTTALLWATLLLAEQTLSTRWFGKPLNVLRFTVALTMIALFRYNGILAFFFLFIGGLIYVLHRRRDRREIIGFALSGVVISVLLALVLVILPPQLNAIENPAGMKLRPIFQGMAALVSADEWHVVKADDREKITAVASLEEMKTHYDPYFADTISSNVPAFLPHLSEWPTKDAVRVYGTSMVRAPAVMLGDRFNLSVSLWSVTPDRFSYNNAFTTHIEQAMETDFGVVRHTNAWTDRIIFRATETRQDKAEAKTPFGRQTLATVFLWRSGFALILMICFWSWALVQGNRLARLVTPIVANGLIVFLTMPAQDYRYLWFLPLITPFLFLTGWAVSGHVPTRKEAS